MNKDLLNALLALVKAMIEQQATKKVNDGLKAGFVDLSSDQQDYANHMVRVAQGELANKLGISIDEIKIPDSN